MNVRIPSLLGSLLLASLAGAGKKEDAAGNGQAVLWRDEMPVSARNLFYGPGGKEHEPHGPFTFLKKDTDASSPKFSVLDRDGVKWKVKLGPEVRSEIAATRLVWAAGYFTDEDYYLPELRVQSVPADLDKRVRRFIQSDGSFPQARLKLHAEGMEKTGAWKWSENPFTGTRELNGLRVLMSLINNWDVKDVNNAVYRRGDELVYMVSDLGASFATTGRSWPSRKSKDNLAQFRATRFICESEADEVDFCAPSRPNIAHSVDPLEMMRRMRLRWVGRGIPRSHAKWVGEILSQLTPEQIRDAFRCAGYAPAEVEGFAKAIAGRIGALTEL